MKVKIFTAVILIVALQCGFIYSVSITGSKLFDNSVVTEKVDYKQDFSGGSVSGWESYPPFQDTGFDPYFYCTRVDAPNGNKYALMFEYHPTFKTEHEMGFIKKLSLVADDNSKVSFYYKADGYGYFKGMKIVLYGTNGKRYSYKTSINDNRRWIFIDVPVKNFKNSGESIKSGIGISGFSMVTYIPKTNPDINYRLYFTDLTIAAMQAVKFKILKPATDYLENIDLIVPLHHYHAGQKFNLSAKLPWTVKLKSADVSLSNPDGKIILQNVSLELNSSTNIWGKDNIYDFSKDDIPGQWCVEINGMDDSGKKVETKFNIWLMRKNIPHPRLFFTDKQINECKEKIKSKHWKSWWDSLINKATDLRNTSNVGSIKIPKKKSGLRNVSQTKLSLESLSKVNICKFDSVHLLPTISHYFDIMQPAEKILQDNALIYAITGDTAAGNYAKKALLIISGWKTWTHPWFTARHRETYYPIGELGVRAAFCYDVVYPLMTKEERDKVSEGLLKNCIIPAYDEYVLQDRVPSATSNWVSNTVSGGLSCALAIYCDDPKLGSLEPYISGLLKKLEININNTLDTAGAWGEGINYQAFAYSNTLPTISAIKNVLNLNLASKSLLGSYKYFLYNFSNPDILDVGDSHTQLSTLSEYAWLSSYSHNPVFQWLYMKSPRNEIFDFMFGSDKGKVTPPTSLPTSIQFPELGAVVFRSGWSPDDIVMNFRSGPFYNHQHFDQGSFQINAFGQSLLTEAGWANYYTNPYYRSYYIQPIGHNTLLLDEDGGSQRSGDFLHFIKAADKHARLKDFITTNFYSSATGKLADIYRGKLSLFERNIIFVNKKYFVVYDRIKSSKDPHSYDLLFHFANSKEAKLENNNTFTFSTDKASLYSQVIFPENIKMKIVDRPVKFGDPITMPGYVQVSNSKKSMEENFLTVLYPVKGDGSVLNLSGDITKLNGNNYIGIKVNENNQIDELLFSTTATKSGNKNIKAGKLEADARVAEVSIKDNKLLNFAGQEAINFNYGGTKYIETNLPVTFAVKMKTKSDRWEFSSHKNFSAKINLTSQPEKIILNGKEPLKSRYHIENSKLSISISKGNNLLEIEY